MNLDLLWPINTSFKFEVYIKKKNDGEKSASGHPFSRSWADQLGYAVGPTSWVARAGFGISVWLSGIS
jgi:hypothetical protein